MRTVHELYQCIGRMYTYVPPEGREEIVSASAVLLTHSVALVLADSWRASTLISLHFTPHHFTYLTPISFMMLPYLADYFTCNPHTSNDSICITSRINGLETADCKVLRHRPPSVYETVPISLQLWLVQQIQSARRLIL